MATWPSESLPRPSPFAADPGRVAAYFLSPSTAEFDLVESHLRLGLEKACLKFGLRAELGRAVTSASPIVVHDEIWNSIYNADVLIYDITGENASVMMELGVGAAWRLKPQIIVLQNKDHRKALPFNLSPARILRYELSPTGLRHFERNCEDAFAWSLSTLPVARATKHPKPEVLPFRYPQNAADLLTPSLCHRHQRVDGALEFGAPHVFTYSFAMPHTGSRTHMRLRAVMSFGDRPFRSDSGSGWIGIKLLGSGVLMNHGVGVVLRPDGRIQYTYQESENGPYRDPHASKSLRRFNPDQDRVTFDASVRGPTFRFSISLRRQRVSGSINLVRKARYRPTSGICLLQAYRCRAVLHDLEIR